MFKFYLAPFCASFACCVDDLKKDILLPFVPVVCVANGLRILKITILTLWSFVCFIHSSRFDVLLLCEFKEGNLLHRKLADVPHWRFAQLMYIASTGPACTNTVFIF